jgi:hypothetical protein
MRLKSSIQPSPEINHVDSSTDHRDHAMAGDQPDDAFTSNSQQFDKPTALEEEHRPNKAPTATQWRTVRPAPRRPHDSHANSPITGDYDKRVISARLALCLASLSSCQRIAKKHAALLDEDPLMLPYPAAECNAPIETLDPPFSPVQQPPRHNAPVSLPLIPPRRLFPRTTFHAVTLPPKPISGPLGRGSTKIIIRSST